MTNIQTKSSRNPAPPMLFISAGFAGSIDLVDVLDPYSADLPARVHDAIIAAWDRILRGLLHCDDDAAIDLLSARLLEARDSMDAAAWRRLKAKFERECYV